VNTLRNGNIGMKKLKMTSFSDLVDEINKKWGHTYEDVKEEDESILKGIKFDYVIIDELPLNDKAE